MNKVQKAQIEKACPLIYGSIRDSVIIILTSKGVIYSNAKRYTALKSLWLLRFLGGQAGFSPGQALRLLSSADSVYSKGSQSLLGGCFLTDVSLEWKWEAPTSSFMAGYFQSASRRPSEQMWLIISSYTNASNYLEIVVVNQSWKWQKAWIFSPQGFNNLNFLSFLP